jgi:hypothetical protein
MDDGVEQLKNGKPYVNELVFSNGSRIVFMFHDQDELIWEGVEIDWAIYDEPPPRHAFIGLSRGQRTKGSKPWQLLIATPISAAWIRTDLYEPWLSGDSPDVEFFRGNTHENEKNLAAGYIKRFSNLLSEDEKKIRLEGQFFDLGSLALAHLFKDATHIVPPSVKIEREWPVIVAIDPHPSKNNVASALAIDPRTGYKYMIGEIAAKLTARPFAHELLAWSKNWRVVDWVCDSLGSADLTGGEGFKSFIQILNDCGIRVRATTYEEKDDEKWIERIQAALELPEQLDNFGQQVPQLRVSASCTNTIKDIKNVSWLKYKGLNENKPKLDISNKDYLACLKYALAASSSLALGARPQPTIRMGQGHASRPVGIRARYFKSTES